MNDVFPVFPREPGDPDLTPPDPDEELILQSPRSNPEEEWEKRFANLLLLRFEDGSLHPLRETFVEDYAWRVPSLSRLDLFHRLARDPMSGRLFCDCEAFTFHGYCKHVFFPEWIARTFDPVPFSDTAFGGVGVVDGRELLLSIEYHNPRCWKARVTDTQSRILVQHAFPAWFVGRLAAPFATKPSWLLTTISARKPTD